jgi:hypothetical protein
MPAPMLRICRNNWRVTGVGDKLHIMTRRLFEKRLIVTDCGDFALDINEFGHLA